MNHSHNVRGRLVGFIDHMLGLVSVACGIAYNAYIMLLKPKLEKSLWHQNSIKSYHHWSQSIISPNYVQSTLAL